MSVDVQQPRPDDLVGNRVEIGGVAGGAFEAGFSCRIHEGHDEVVTSFLAGDGAGGHGQFHLAVDVSAPAFTAERLFVEVFHVSPQDGAELDKVSVRVLLGRIIVPGYRNYLEHTVVPGEPLWTISQRYYGSGDLYHRLVAANPQIENPSVIHPGDVVRVPQT